jgi:hypothetical protein
MIRRSDSSLTFRELVEEDAPAVLQLVHLVLEKAKTTITSPQEFVVSPEEERSYLQKLRANPFNLALGAFEKEELVGVLFLEQLAKQRTCHRAVLSFSVHPARWSSGIGAEQFSHWCRGGHECHVPFSSRKRHLRGR